MLGFPVRSFVVLVCPVPSGHKNELATALQHARLTALVRELQTPTQATLPVLCFSNTSLPARHRRTTGGSKGPSRISDAFHPDGHVARRTNLQTIALCPSLPAGHSFRVAQAARFRGHETRSVPLPTSDDDSRFGTVSIRVYSQALSRLSWLSFSPPGFSPGRRKRYFRFHLSPGGSSPREPG